MLAGEKVRLWSIEREDLLKNYIWQNDPNVIYLTGFCPYPKSFFEIEKWYNNLLLNPTIRTFAIKTKEGEYIGNIELNKIDFQMKKAEMGIFIGESDFLNKGYGYDTVNILLKFAFNQMNLNRIYIKVIEYNQEAMKFFEKFGFKKEGVLRQAFYYDNKYYNINLYSLLKEEYKGSN